MAEFAQWQCPLCIDNPISQKSGCFTRKKKQQFSSWSHKPSMVDLGMSATHDAGDACGNADKLMQLPVPNAPAAHAWQHFQLGKFLYKAKNMSKALECFHATLRYNPYFSKAHFFSSIILCDLNKLQWAENHLLHAVRGDQRCVLNALVNLSVIYLKRRLFRKALHAIKLCIKLDKYYIYAHMNLSSVLRCLGQRDLAVRLQWLMVLLNDKRLYISDDALDCLIEGLSATSHQAEKFTGDAEDESLPQMLIDSAQKYAEKQKIEIPSAFASYGDSLVPNGIKIRTLLCPENPDKAVLLTHSVEYINRNPFEKLIGELTTAFQMLQRYQDCLQLNCQALILNPSYTFPLKVVCVKWGKLYSAAYVNNLYWGVEKHLTVSDIPYPSYDFVCLTDDPSDLHPSIKIELLQGPKSAHLEPTEMRVEKSNAGYQVNGKYIEDFPKKGWWNKLYLFRENSSLCGCRCLYFDLDTIIIGDISSLATYDGPFALVNSKNICYDTGNGYNSSIMSWVHESTIFSPLLKLFTEQASDYIHRFDYWLEMMLHNVDYLDLYSRKILDYGNMKFFSPVGKLSYLYSEPLATKQFFQLNKKPNVLQQHNNMPQCRYSISFPTSCRHSQDVDQSQAVPSVLSNFSPKEFLDDDEESIEEDSINRRETDATNGKASEETTSIGNHTTHLCQSVSVIIFPGKTKPHHAIREHSWLRNFWNDCT